MDGWRAYNFIICTTRVVCPCSFLHYPLRHGLEIHEVIASCQRRHLLDSLFTLGLFGVKFFLLLLDSRHVDFTEMFRLVEVFI